MQRLIAVFFVISTILISQSSVAAQKSVWSDAESFSAPESVYYNSADKTLYISNVVGAGDKKDGKGWISKIKPDGKVVSVKWVDKLNAPKGMRSQNGTLWVSDIDRVVAIDIKSGKIKSSINIAGSKFLNDIAIAPDDTVYVSDTQGATIYKIKDGKASVFLTGEILEAPNGLLYKDGKLYVAGWGKGIKPDWSTTDVGRIYCIDLKTKKMTYITKKPLGNLDGLEMDSDGNFIVSDWVAGKIYKVDLKGKSKLIFEGKKGIADIAYIPSTQMVVVPQMQENEVTAIKY